MVILVTREPNSPRTLWSFEVNNWGKVSCDGCDGLHDPWCRTVTKLFKVDSCRELVTYILGDETVKQLDSRKLSMRWKRRVLHERDEL